MDGASVYQATAKLLEDEHLLPSRCAAHSGSLSLSWLVSQISLFESVYLFANEIILLVKGNKQIVAWMKQAADGAASVLFRFISTRFAYHF